MPRKAPWWRFSLSLYALLLHLPSFVLVQGQRRACDFRVLPLPVRSLPRLTMDFGSKNISQRSQPVAEEMEMEDRKGMAGTAKDAAEMDRLGRQQVLNVSIAQAGWRRRGWTAC